MSHKDEATGGSESVSVSAVSGLADAVSPREKTNANSKGPREMDGEGEMEGVLL